jgi:hypothetical protein
MFLVLVTCRSGKPSLVEIQAPVSSAITPKERLSGAAFSKGFSANWIETVGDSIFSGTGTTCPSLTSK